MKFHILAATFAMAFGASAMAQTATPNLDQRQANQEKRIEHGVASAGCSVRLTATARRSTARSTTRKSRPSPELQAASRALSASVMKESA